MTATRPNEGLVYTFTPNPVKAAFKPLPKGGTASGSWRPNTDFSSTEGLLISLRREQGLTTGDALRVPLRFQAPVLNEFTRPYRSSVATYDTISDGQKSRSMGDQLLDLTIDTVLLDDVAADGSQGLIVWDGAANPQAMIRELNAIRRGSQKFRLVISQPAVWGNTPLINMLAEFTGVTPTQRPGEIGTEYLSLSFLEYDEGVLARKQRPAAHGSNPITIRDGDTLHMIALRSHYHRASAWREIADYNGIAGVSPSSSEELAAWATKHGRTQLRVPALTT